MVPDAKVALAWGRETAVRYGVDNSVRQPAGNRKACVRVLVGIYSSKIARAVI
jgi:hypothetical protein